MAKKNKLSAYILLDRSGSMGGARWETAISSINQYVETLKKTKNLDANITVSAFDTGDFSKSVIESRVNSALSFVTIRDNVSIKEFKSLEATELSPRGGTPLYDATAQIINMAETDNNKKSVIIIMTDGEENSSKEYNLAAIKARIEGCIARDWEVVFLGAEFNADNTARSYGLDSGKVISTTLKNTCRTMDWYADASAAYATGMAIDTTAVKADLAK